MPKPTLELDNINGIFKNVINPSSSNEDELDSISFELSNHPLYMEQMSDDFPEVDFDLCAGLTDFEKDDIGTLNSVNIDGVVESVIFNDDGKKQYLTVKINNITDGKYSNRVTVTWFGDSAIEFKHKFNKNDKVRFFNLTLSIVMHHSNKNDKNIYPRMIYKQTSNYEIVL